MTSDIPSVKYKKRSRSRWLGSLYSLCVLFAVLMCAIFLSSDIAEYIRDGAMLALTRVIPTTLPFMIISEWYICYGNTRDIPILGRLFEAIFGMPRAALSALLLGNICGFPIGMRSAGELYRSGILDKRSAEVLAALSNNPSAAFLIGSVGAGLYGDATVGIRLFLYVIASSLICGLIFRKKTNNIEYSDVNFKQKYNFVESVKGAGSSCITVISFISVFFTLGKLVGKFVNFPIFSTVIFAFLEVSGAVSLFASDGFAFPSLSMPLSAFSLGFGGISVMMQSAVFSGEYGLSMKRYFPTKLIQGVLCAVLCLIFEKILLP